MNQAHARVIAEHQVATVPLVCLLAAGATVTTYLAVAILEVHQHATSAAQSPEASQAVKLLLTRSLRCAAMPHHVRRPLKPSFVLQESSPTPIFGSASTFGGGSGFGGFSGVAAGQSSGGRRGFGEASARQQWVHKTVCLYTTMFEDLIGCSVCAGFGGGSTAQGEAPREEGEEDGGGGDEEECSAEFKPVVQLDEVEVQVRTPAIQAK